MTATAATITPSFPGPEVEIFSQVNSWITSEKSETQKMFFSSGNSLKGIYLQETSDRFRIAIISLESDLQVPVEVLASERNLHAVVEGRLSDVALFFHRLALEKKCILRAAIMELRAADQKPDEPGLIHAVTAGLPSAIMMRSGEFSFPLRSGIPAGIVSDWIGPAQVLEWQKGDQLYVYTDSAVPDVPLDEKLKSGADLTKIPDDMILVLFSF